LRIIEHRAGSAIALMILLVAWPFVPKARRLGALLPVALLGALIACGGNNTSPPVTRPPGSATATVSPTSLTFNSQTVQTTSAPQAVSLTNGGSAALTISSIGASGDFAQTNTCGGALAAGGTCSLAVTFTPTAAGERTGAVTIADNASNSPQTVGLTGSGIS